MLYSGVTRRFTGAVRLIWDRNVQMYLSPCYSINKHEHNDSSREKVVLLCCRIRGPTHVTAPNCRPLFVRQAQTVLSHSPANYVRKVDTFI